ncbi:carbohydrate-binding family 9-like protein [Ancylomarina sp. YFZ004]
MRNYFIISSLILITLFSCEDKNKKDILINVSTSIVNPNHYIVSKTAEDIQIDGVADESSWKSAQYTESFIDIEGIKIPKYDTKVKMLWDDKYLYVYSQMEEPHVWGNLKQRDTVIFYNNDFEIFVDPSGTATNYVEIEINALGTVWDLALNKPYRVGGKANDSWNVDGLKSAVNIVGSLNQSDDTDKQWSVEFAIPLIDLIEQKQIDKNLPIEGEQWRINFSRVEWEHDLIDGKYQRKKENDKYLSEYNWVWSQQNVINMHEPEKWGFLQFTEQNSSESTEFIADTDMQIKQIAYALFRDIRFGANQVLLEKKEGFHQTIKAQYADNQFVSAEFIKTETGFSITIKNTETKNAFIINEEGVLKSKQ